MNIGNINHSSTAFDLSSGAHAFIVYIEQGMYDQHVLKKVILLHPTSLYFGGDRIISDLQSPDLYNGI
jgi:hypothetical protein